MMDPRDEHAQRHLDLARKAVLRAFRKKELAPWQQVGTEDVDSLAQVVYLRLFCHGAAVRFFEQIVWRTAYNVVVDALRLAHRCRLLDDPDCLGEVEDDATDHEESYDRSETTRALIDAVLDRLSPGEKEVVETVVKLDLDLSNSVAIGNAISVETNAVAARVYRIRNKAKKALQPRFDELESR